MKKFLTLLLVLLSGLSAYAGGPKIVIDKVEEDGSRVVFTSEETLYTTWSSGSSFGLSATVAKDGSVLYFLNLTLNEGDITMEKGRKLLLKLKSGETIELQISNPIGPGDYTIHQSSLGIDHLYHPFYPISEEVIQKLLKDDVVKVRVEDDAEHYDRNVKKFMKRFNELYKLLTETLATSNSVYDNF